MENKRLGKLRIKEIREKILNKVGILGKEVLLGPKVGADSAILKTKEVIAIHSDPITGAKKNIGKLAMMIASNDIVAIGAKPKFATLCIILPQNCSIEDAEEIQEHASNIARKMNISIVGGHVEFSPIVNNPLVVTTIVGEMLEDYEERLKELKRIKEKPEEYLIVQIKPLALEATAILAYDYEDKLSSKIKKEEIEEAKKLIEELSIYDVGLKIFENRLAVYAHDPTEGGLIVALKELAEFLEVGFKVYEEKMLILDLTKKILKELNLNPLKSLSSGCMVCVIKKNKKDEFEEFMKRNKIAYSIIGELKESGCEIISKDGIIDVMKEGEEEELWKLFSF
jgi:hydrogenase expression/formation protein HypE